MAESGFWIRFVLAVLATWRVTHLLASEDGPWDLIARARARLGGRFAGRLMDCFQCLSLWIAAPMAVFVTRAPLELLLTWLALSGAACLLNLLDAEPVVIQPVAERTEGSHHRGMLWSETRSASELAAGHDEPPGVHSSPPS